MPSVDPTPTTTLTDNLRRLGLTHTADDLNDLVARATQKRWSPVVLLETLVQAELKARTRRRVERRLRDACTFPTRTEPELGNSDLYGADGKAAP